MNEKLVEPEETGGAESPNGILAKQIVEALAEAGLVVDRHHDDMLAKLESGVASQDDWGIWVDIATDPQRADVEVSHE